MRTAIRLLHKSGDNNAKLSCETCRHANQVTIDFEDGLLFCSLRNGIRNGMVCDVIINTSRGDYYLYEQYEKKPNTSNCTWYSNGELEVTWEVDSNE